MGSRNQQRAKIDGSSPFAKRPTISGLTDSLIDVEPGSALVVAEDGSIQVGQFTLTARGLVAGTDVSFDEWQQLGKVLQRFEASIQWLIGDWMAYGERIWGQTYEAVAAATGYSYQTLQDYAWVVRHVDFSIRIEKLSFSHHRLVAALPLEEQRRWLEYAAENNLSLSQMRTAMIGSPPPLSSGLAYDRLFSRESKPNISRIEKLFVKAGQGDRRAGDNLLSQIEQHRQWLDELERVIRDRS